MTRVQGRAEGLWVSKTNGLGTAQPLAGSPYNTITFPASVSPNAGS